MQASITLISNKINNSSSSNTILLIRAFLLSQKLQLLKDNLVQSLLPINNQYNNNLKFSNSNSLNNSNNNNKLNNTKTLLRFNNSNKSLLNKCLRVDRLI